MEAFVEKEVCVFVGGTGTKAGVVQAGGCTKEWLLSKGCDPSSLFGPDGGCVYQGMDLYMDGDGVVAGAAGQFAGVEPGMVAFSDGDMFQTYYEVTAVGASFESITLGGYNFGMEDTVDLYIGGAFSSLQQAFFCSTAYHKNCWVFTNKNEVLAATANLTYNGGDPKKNTWKRAMGYNQTLSYANGVFVSDMDEGQAFYRSAEKIMQEGIGSGCKVVLDGSAVAAAAVNFQRDNMELRNLYVVGGAGYDCMYSQGGYTGHSHGLILKGCAFDGGLNGFNGTDGCDGVVLDDCWAGPGISGWGFRVQDSVLAGKSVHLSRCVADGCRQRHAAAGRVPVAAIDACTGSSHCEKPWVGYMPTEKR